MLLMLLLLQLLLCATPAQAVVAAVARDGLGEAACSGAAGDAAVALRAGARRLEATARAGQAMLPGNYTGILRRVSSAENRGFKLPGAAAQGASSPSPRQQQRYYRSLVRAARV